MLGIPYYGEGGGTPNGLLFVSTSVRRRSANLLAWNTCICLLRIISHHDAGFHSCNLKVDLRGGWKSSYEGVQHHINVCLRQRSFDITRCFATAVQSSHSWLIKMVFLGESQRSIVLGMDNRAKRESFLLAVKGFLKSLVAWNLDS